MAVSGLQLTQDAAPEVPRGLTAREVRDATAALVWGPVPGAQV